MANKKNTAEEVSEIEETVEEEVVEEVIKEKKQTKPKAVDAEKEEMKAKLATLEKQLELLTQALTMAQSQPKQEKKVDRNIKIINMTAGDAILKGTRVYELKGQFSSRNFLEHEAKVILSNMPEMFTSGNVYIADAQFVEDNDLADAYQHILSDKQMKELLKKSPDVVVEAYKNTSAEQQRIIIDMVVDKRLNGIKIDNNTLAELGEICGRNLLGIEEMPRE